MNINLENVSLKTASGQTFVTNEKSIDIYTIPDIICVQNAKTEELQRFDSLPNLHMIGLPFEYIEVNDTSSNFSAIFYNHLLLVLIEKGTFWLSTTPLKPSKTWNSDKQLASNWALFTDSNNHKFYVFSIQLNEENLEDQMEAFKLLIAHISMLNPKIPVILCGNFDFHASLNGNHGLLTFFDDLYTTSDKSNKTIPKNEVFGTRKMISAQQIDVNASVFEDSIKLSLKGFLIKFNPLVK